MYKKQAKELVKTLLEVPAVQPYGGKTAAYPVATTNFNLRQPTSVIIHHTAMNSCESTVRAFTRPQSKVSAHYVICKDGTVHHMLNDYLRAWHAGVSRWGATADINAGSLGIELDNNGYEPFAEAQINSLLALLARLKSTYRIPAGAFISHADIAPGRKVDPNAHFPWKRLAAAGYGYWYDEPVSQPQPGSLDSYNALDGLRLIGYDTRDSAAAMSAFKLHFMPEDKSPVVDDRAKSIIINLVNKYKQ